MTDNSFLDTNILVYSYDTHDAVKQEKAQAILAGGVASETCFLSVQVLGEFFNVVTKQIQDPMSPEEAKKIVDILCFMPVLDIDLAMVKRAIDTHIVYYISYWDALIIAAAERAECKQIYSEDLNHGQIYNDIRVKNPFI
jgi:predicted nucleic acid-binding protein